MNNFAIFYRILTKYGTIYIYHLSVNQISMELDNPFSLDSNFHIDKKKEKEKKNKGIKPIFESLYLRNAWHDLVEIWNVGY